MASFYVADKILQKTIKEVASKYGITYQQAYDIYDARFGAISKELEKLDILNDVFPTVKIPYLASFYITDVKRKFLKTKELERIRRRKTTNN